MIYYTTVEDRKVIASFSESSDVADLKVLWFKMLKNEMKRFEDMSPQENADLISLLLELVSRKTNFVGMSVCTSEDKFDESVGRRIAKNKLLRKYHHILYIIMRERFRQMDTKLFKFKMRWLKHYSYLNRLDKVVI